MRLDGAGEGGEVVPALQNGDDAPLRMLLRQGNNPLRDLSVILLRQLEPCERVFRVAVESGGNENNLRPKRFHGGSKEGVERPEDVRAARAGGKRRVDRRSHPVPGPLSSALPVPG